MFGGGNHRGGRGAAFFALALALVCAATGRCDPVKTVCPERLSLNIEGHTVCVPYCANVSLEKPSPRIERAVIGIHGMNRTAAMGYLRLVEAATKAGVIDTCLIVALQFLTAEDLDAHALGDDMLYWSSGGWKTGYDSKDTKGKPRPVTVSSFTVVDQLLAILTEQQRFPNLTHLVVAGHSAGGQFVNRYAAGSRKAATLGPVRYALRFVVANPSSYVYFNEERRVEGTQDQFAVPPASTVAKCPYYNRYRYGLDALNDYMAGVGVARIRAQYQERTVYYLLGEDDNNPEHASLDTSCQALLEGRHRLERGIVYYNYLRHYFGAGITQRHFLRTVPGVAHSSRGIFSSPQGIEALFDVTRKDQ